MTIDWLLIYQEIDIVEKILKKMNNILVSDKKIQRNYTGLNGRDICFQFPTEKEKEDFKTHIISFMDNCI